LKCTVFIATSLDGFIARPNGDLDWLPQAVLVMGRNTYDVVCSLGEWPYGDKRVAVLTARPIDLPPDSKVTALSGSPSDVIAELAKDGAQHLYIDGGRVVTNFLRDGLIDEIIITTIPILIGKGIPLFGELNKDVALELLSTKSFDGGLAQSHYRVL
jgi:dihydrofolate reductase